jgi:hypothetical protein
MQVKTCVLYAGRGLPVKDDALSSLPADDHSGCAPWKGLKRCSTASCFLAPQPVKMSSRTS